MELEFANGTAAELPVSAKDAVEFTPERYRPSAPADAPTPDEKPPFPDDAPVYYLRVPTGRTKNKLDAALSLAQRRFPSQRKVLRTLKEGVRALVAGHQQGEVLEIIEAFEQAGSDRSMDTEERRDLQEKVSDIEVQIAERYEPLRALHENQAYANALLVQETIRHYVVGWDGLDAEPELKNGVLRSADTIPEADQLAIYNRVATLSHVSEGQAKNSGSRSSRANGRKNSKGQKKTPTTPGKSTANSTSEIPSGG